MRKTVSLFLAVLLLLAAFSGCAKKTVLLEKSASVYVNDAASVLSGDTENYVVERVQNLKRACGGEIAVVTVTGTGSLAIDDYSYNLFNQWGIGDKTKNNGMLVVIDTVAVRCYLTLGYGIESDVSQPDIQNWMQQLYNYMALAKYDTGVRNLTDTLIGWYCDFYGVSVS